MAELLIIRHGQASFGLSDYDHLSETGYQQSRWLGEHLRLTSQNVDSIITGSLKRQLQTADGICEGLQDKPPRSVLEGLNEYDFISLHKEFCRQFPSEESTHENPRKKYYSTLHKALVAWSEGSISGTETWIQFKERTAATLSTIQAMPEKRLIAVSSGGAISTIVGAVLNLEPKVAFQLNMQIKNTSVSQFYLNRRSVKLASFNNTPHLEQIDRRDAITYS